MKTQRDAFVKELASVALPIALQSLLTSLVGASDALMLGFLEQSALSAISLATQVQFVLTLFHAAFMIGASVLAAQYWGKGDAATVEKVLAISLRVSLPVSLLFCLAALALPEWLMRLFTDDGELVALGAPYLRFVSASYLLTGASQMYLNIMKNSGRVGRSTLYGSLAVVLNIVLNVVLIFGFLGAPRLGIAGAAVATVLSRAAELLLCVQENRRRNVVRFRLCLLLRADGRLSRQYRRHTLPVLANEIAWGGGFTMFSVIMGHLGSDAVAANSVTNIIRNILTCFCTGLGAGSAILIGNLLGAGELERAKAYSRRLLAASLLCGAAGGALILAATPAVLRFSSALSAQARAYIYRMMLVSAYYVVARSLNGVLIEGTFCAGGDTKFGFYCDLVNMWLVILPLASLAAFVLRLPVMAVYVILNMDEIGKIPFEIAHYRKYTWLRNVTEVQHDESGTTGQGPALHLG